MKYRNVFAKILSEVSGKSETYVNFIIDECIRLRPDTRFGFEKELSETEGISLLDQLRKEKSGIYNWLLSGCVEHSVKMKEN